MRFRAQGISGLDVAAAAELISGGRPFVLDVREDDEWAAGHIPAATHIPMAQVEARLHELPKNAGIVTVCRSGNRSGAVATELARRGYRVRNLSDGMVAWHAAGLPMEQAGASVA